MKFILSAITILAVFAVAASAPATAGQALDAATNKVGELTNDLTNGANDAVSQGWQGLINVVNGVDPKQTAADLNNGVQSVADDLGNRVNNAAAALLE